MGAQSILYEVLAFIYKIGNLINVINNKNVAVEM
jgi:hypothetical protein